MNKNTALTMGIAGVVLLVGLSVFGIGKAGTSVTPIERTDFLLNTFVNIKIYDSEDTAVLDNAIAICKDYEDRFSRTIESSEIYKMNHRAADEQTFHLSDETAGLLKTALHYCEISGGAFDVTIEPASSLWDFTAEEPAIPDAARLADAVKKVDYKKLRMEGNTLTFLSPDTTLDLGAIAKGYIADQIKAYLVENGVKSAIINLGGNVLCIGNRPDKTAFRIGLQKPFAKTSETFATAAISDMSVVTSGVYERHFIIDDTNYHHILNPQTGYPYDNGLISVTILSESSVDGDGLSTTCFSLGLEKGMDLLNSMDGVYGCFIDDHYNVYYSDGMEAFLSDTSK